MYEYLYGAKKSNVTMQCLTRSCRAHDNINENYSSLPAVLPPAGGQAVSCGQYCRFGRRGRTMVWFCGGGSFYKQQDSKIYFINPLNSISCNSVKTQHIPTTEQLQLRAKKINIKVMYIKR